MSEIERRALLGVVGAVGAAGLAAMAKGGPLSPPSGAVAGTGRTLDEVEPRKTVFSAPSGMSGVRTLSAGAYKLTSSMGAAPLTFQTHARVDLCGFSITGGAGPFTFSVSSPVVSGLEVRNGVVLGTVFASGNAPNDSLFENVFFQNASVFAGRNCVFRNCIFFASQLTAGIGCRVESCSFYNQSLTGHDSGLDVGDNSVVRDLVFYCDVSGGSGVSAGNGSVMERCSVYYRGVVGIGAGTGSVLTDCTVQGPTSSLFVASAGCTLTGCVAEGSAASASFCFNFGPQVAAERCCSRFGGTGFVCGEDAVLRNCLAFDAAGAGFNCLGAGTSFEACTARNNGGIGFALANSSKIERCLAVANAGGGYRITSDTLVRGNHADSNSVVSFLVTSSDNRVEGNSVSDGAGVGIQVDVTGNLVIGNSVSGVATPYAIAAGNAAGPIVGTAGVATNTVSTANFSF